MRNRKIKFVQYASSAMLLGGALAIVVVSGEAQTDLPATAPQVREVLPSYEGQNVISVEVAGRPDLDQRQLLPVLVQQEGQPFSQAKIDQSVSALKSRGVVKEVQVEIRPQANGIRVLLVCQPAVYYGLFDFPGAVGKFPSPFS
jgi:outer membrane protein insertion porin family